MFQVIVQFPSHPSRVFSSPAPITLDALRAHIHAAMDIPQEEQRIVTLGGKTVLPASTLEHGQILHCNCTLVGGKGGFGSMLRHQGGRMASKVATNIGACRDLGGKRLKDLELAKDLSEYQSRLAKEKAEKEARIDQKIQRALKVEAEVEAPKKIDISASPFLETQEKTIERVSDSFLKGVEERKRFEEEQKSKDERKKRKGEEAMKKLAHWDVDHYSGSDVSDSDDDESHARKKVKRSEDTPKESSEEPKEKAKEEPKEEPKEEEKREEEPPKEAAEKVSETRVREVKLLQVTPMEISTAEPKEEATPTPAPAAETKEAKAFEQIDVAAFESAKDLEPLGLEHLKAELTRHGLKCGGTLQERAERLFLLKSTKLEDLPAKLFAKGKKGK